MNDSEAVGSESRATIGTVVLLASAILPVLDCCLCVGLRTEPVEYIRWRIIFVFDSLFVTSETEVNCNPEPYVASHKDKIVYWSRVQLHARSRS